MRKTEYHQNLTEGRVDFYQGNAGMGCLRDNIVGAKNFSPLRDVGINHRLERRADRKIGPEVTAIIDPRCDAESINDGDI